MGMNNYVETRGKKGDPCLESRSSVCSILAKRDENRVSGEERKLGGGDHLAVATLRTRGTQRNRKDNGLMIWRKEKGERQDL